MTPDHQSVRKKGLSPTIAGTGFYPTLIPKVDSSPDPGAKSPADVLTSTLWNIGKDPDAGKIKGGRRNGWQRVRWLAGISDSMDRSLSKLRETVKVREAGRAVVHEVAKSRTGLSNWTTTTPLWKPERWFQLNYSIHLTLWAHQVRLHWFVNFEFPVLQQQ